MENIAPRAKGMCSRAVWNGLKPSPLCSTSAVASSSEAVVS
ncbi:hypothetical protein [Klebsiella pneumoniae]|nr:hypothetical protein [Klebsiella pneumoniae]